MQTAKILIADDDAITRRLLEELVTSLGHQVVMASDGGEALALLEGDDPPGLALLDWVMPVMDGLEVCRTLRGRGDRSLPTYVILLTARSQKSEVVTGLRAGANDYVVKPFDRAELAARIEMGVRTSCTERRLRTKVREADGLRERLAEVERLLPCPACRRTNGDAAYWGALERALRASDAVPECPGCLVKA